MFLLLATACGVEPAPEDLDGLVHWLWDHQGEAGDKTDALANLAAALAPLDSEVTGDLTDLSAEQVAGYSDGDPSLSRGLVMARSYACTLDALAPILYALDQDALYQDVYGSYDRSYTSDLDAYEQGESDAISWEVTLSSELLGVTYTEHLLGDLQRVSEDDGGPALIGRISMPGPASFDSDGWTWTQDFQIEAWLEPSPGELWHVYGLWRDMDLGGLDMDNDGVASTTLSSMSDWDSETEVLCSGEG